jgi:hypothetical protein
MSRNGRRTDIAKGAAPQHTAYGLRESRDSDSPAQSIILTRQALAVVQRRMAAKGAHASKVCIWLARRGKDRQKRDPSACWLSVAALGDRNSAEPA